MSRFDANDVWALAVAVDRMNDGYVKTDEFIIDKDTGESTLVKRPNKVVLKSYLNKEDYADITADDMAEAVHLRTHFNGYLLKELSGKINDFERSVLRISQMKEFTNRSLLEFAIISCLPNSYRREMKHRTHLQEIVESTPVDGEVGDVIQGELIVSKCYYNENYNKFRIVGRFGEAFVDFWYKDQLDVDSTVRIKGRIKQVRPDNTTQLHYVKEIKE